MYRRIVSLCLLWGIVCIATQTCWGLTAKNVPMADGNGIASLTVETQAYRVTIDFERGARIISFYDKQNKTDGVSWDAAQGAGGFLNDRHTFTEMSYKTKYFKASDKNAKITVSASSNDKIELIKTFIFDEEKPFIQVIYQVNNSGFAPYSLWCKCIGVPGGGKLQKDDVSVFFQTEGEIKTFSRWPNDYYANVGGWMALLRSSIKSGYFIKVDPEYIDKFYFWSGSEATPTFEWIYKECKPGYSFTTKVLVGLVDGLASVGSIDKSGNVSAQKVIEEKSASSSHSNIPGWKSIGDLYSPTQQEKEQGFIITTSGDKEPHRRLAQVKADVGMEEEEVIPVEVFSLEDLENIHLEFDDVLAKEGNFRWEGEIDYKLKPYTPVSSSKGTYSRLYLRLLPSQKARTISGNISVVSNKGKTVLPLSVRVWPLQIPFSYALPLKAYAVHEILGSHAFLDGKDQQQFPAMLDAIRKCGGTVSEWSMNFNPGGLFKYVKEKKTGLPFYEFLKNNAPLSVNAFPELDFSAYDKIVGEYKKRGIMRVEFETGGTGNPSGWEMVSYFGEKAFKRKITDQEGWEIKLWFGKEIKKYMDAHGFTDLWVKIGDEIAPSDIPLWLNAAHRWRAIGFKAYTTNTVGIPRSAELLNEMNKESDGYQVAYCYTRDFIKQTRQGTSTEKVSMPLTPPIWERYANGGAENTYSTPRGFIPFPSSISFDQVEDMVVIADGKRLKKCGGSPWGNKQEGVCFLLGNAIYLSLPEKKHPKTASLSIEFLKRNLGGDIKAVNLKKSDSLWYYSGGSYYKQPNLNARRVVWLGCHYALDGHGYYVFYHWLPERRLFFYSQGNPLIFSPAYEGLRDAAEDSAYYRYLKANGVSAADLSRIVGFGENAVLRLTEKHQQEFRYDDIDDNTTYEQYNQAKVLMLQLMLELKNNESSK